jgi:hypothetical protein
MVAVVIAHGVGGSAVEGGGCGAPGRGCHSYAGLRDAARQTGGEFKRDWVQEICERSMHAADGINSCRMPGHCRH